MTKVEISSVRSTYCFVASGKRLAQIVRITLAGAPAEVDTEVTLLGEGFEVPAPWRGRAAPDRAGSPDGPAWVPGADAGLARPSLFSPAPPPPLPEGVVVEIPILAECPSGTVLRARAVARGGNDQAERDAELVVRDPGWRMLMVAHFHYDPVWWNTQAGLISGWDELAWALDRRESFCHTGLALVEAHLERARADARYKFVIAEVDYLKPFWDLYPDRREELQALLGAGRVEVVGGTYNEPNTNLTGAETAIRAAVYGIGFQRDVLGGDPRSAWQLDVFGHDPQFPGIMADCGLDSAAFARGPFHQWGPMRGTGSNAWMQFPSEFEWIAPNGKGILTSYMANHYAAGWELERATTLPGAMWRAYELFEDLADVSTTPVTLLPVGSDYSPPSQWIGEIARTWQERYVWPRFEVGLPKEFFAAVREELARRKKKPWPQTRDMNPIYTGKEVSFIDTKQAQRLAETNLAEAETMTALASLLGWPASRRAVDKAWRQLVFGAHHDGITGSEGDQVYLDLLGDWREAYELARAVAERSRSEVVAAIDTTGEGQALVVTNTLGGARRDVAEANLPPALLNGDVVVLDDSGAVVPAMVELSSSAPEYCLRILAGKVPGMGYRTYRVRSSGERVENAGWTPGEGLVIRNEHVEVAADPKRGGGLIEISERRSGFELLPAGEVGNELLVYPEYSAHPLEELGEGPWHLLPAGPPVRSSAQSADVRREISALGERLVVNGRVDGFHYRQLVTLWRGVRRIELRTEIHDWAAADCLLRLRLPTRLAGGTPVSAVGDAVVARGFAFVDVDVAETAWTLDNPAAEWFGLSTTLVIECSEVGRTYHRRSVGVGELVTPPGDGGADWARDLLIALVQKGVTATCSEAGRNRYGALLGDSNLPDFRIAVGGPAENPFVEALFEGAEGYRSELEGQLREQGWGRVLVPALRSLREVWKPDADLRGARLLPVIVVAGRDPEAMVKAVGELVSEVRSGRVRIEQPAALVPDPEQVPEWTVALLNRGTPGFAIDSGGALHVSLLRACTGWPSGVWIDPPRRSAPDGSNFELEHWSHVFEHAILLDRGDWRAARCVEEAQAYNRPLRASLVEPHTGPLPPHASLLQVTQRKEESGRGTVILATLKPAGNPLASGDADTAMVPAGGATGLSLRCYEADGYPAEVLVESPFRLEGAWRANLLEHPAEPLDLVAGDGGGRGVTVTLDANELATVRLDFAPGTVAPSICENDRDTEVAQPVFSRYWLHNRGSAPIGNQALAVHVTPTAIVLRAGDSTEIVAQVASSSAHQVQAGTVELHVVENWQVDPPSKIFSLAPGAYLRMPVQLRVPEHCHPGRYFVAARVKDNAGQSQQDVVTIDVLPPLAEAVLADGRGGAARERLLTPAPFGHPSMQLPAELEAVLELEELLIPQGGVGKLALSLTNRTRGVMSGEVQLLSPIETWPFVTPWSQGFALAPAARSRIEVDVLSPAQGWLSTWALFKLTYFGRLWYSPVVALRLGAAPDMVSELASARNRRA